MTLVTWQVLRWVRMLFSHFRQFAWMLNIAYLKIPCKIKLNSRVNSLIHPVHLITSSQYPMCQYICTCHLSIYHLHWDDIVKLLSGMNEMTTMITVTHWHLWWFLDWLCVMWLDLKHFSTVATRWCNGSPVMLLYIFHWKFKSCLLLIWSIN